MECFVLCLSLKGDSPAWIYYPFAAFQGSEGGPEELWLLDVGQAASGVYTCEVTTEAPPTFLTANVSFIVTVIGEC